MSKKTGKIIKCNVCSKEKYFSGCEIKNINFCSYDCYHISKRNVPLSEIHKNRISESLKKNIPSTAFKKGCVSWFKDKIMPKGKDAYNYKRGYYVGVRGYVYVLCPNHPRANIKGYVQRSHIEIEKNIGRQTQKGEVVHHINKITNDDRPENLQLFKNQSEHMKFHRTNP